MQKLDFSKDGKLVAYTDNGCTDGKSATTEVKGTFEVSADVVNFILAKEYDLPATIRIEMGEECLFGHYRYEYLYCLLGNDKQQKLLQEYKQSLDEVKDELTSVVGWSWLTVTSPLWGAILLLILSIITPIIVVSFIDGCVWLKGEIRSTIKDIVGDRKKQ